MKELIFSGESRVGTFMFQKMLNWLEKPVRHKWGEPDLLVKAAGINQNQRILEIGCGSGYFTPIIANIVGDKGSVEAIDLHPSAVDATQKKIDSLGISNVQVNQGDAHKTSYADESYDAVLLYGVVPAPVISESRLAREIFRLLKPGGTLAVWTLAPFWTPKKIMKSAPFLPDGKKDGVFRLKKTEGRD